jgi:hypothetical protein
MSALYRKKPLPVEARQLLGSEDGQLGRDLADWCGGSVAGTFSEPKVWVPTLEGGLTARCGDWIVKGPREEFWPVKGSIFAETYEDAATPLTAFRASHDSIVMGLYTTAAAAREHCEAEERYSWGKGDAPSFDWIEDEEDGVAELTAWVGGEECATGYIVTAIEVASKYDEEASA